MTSTEVMNLTSLPEDCSLEDIHYHLSVLIKIGTALAETQRRMNIPALPLKNREKQARAAPHRLRMPARKGGRARTAANSDILGAVVDFSGGLKWLLA